MAGRQKTSCFNAMKYFGSMLLTLSVYNFAASNTTHFNSSVSQNATFIVDFAGRGSLPSSLGLLIFTLVRKRSLSLICNSLVKTGNPKKYQISSLCL